jgi:hypothetical protein
MNKFIFVDLVSVFVSLYGLLVTGLLQLRLISISFNIIFNHKLKMWCVCVCVVLIKYIDFNLLKKKLLKLI